MKTLPKLNFANVRCRLMPANGSLPTKRPARIMLMHSLKQRGVVLFLTLLALLAMSLAAVALIRSVDTSAMIAGNLAFKQLATNAASTQIEAAITWLATQQATNSGKIVGTDPSHTFNTDPPGSGYLSFIDLRDLTVQSVWIAVASGETVDLGGNRNSYVIQRMCRDDATPIESTKCLYGADAEEGGGQKGIVGSEDACDPGACDNPTSFPQYRITVRTIGPKNSISYVQAFAY